MTPSSNIPGLRGPTEAERGVILAQWTGGTNPRTIRGGQIALGAACVVLGAMGTVSGGIAMGVTIGLLFALLFSPFFIVMDRRIRKLCRYALLLERGAYRLTTAKCTWRGTSRYAGGYLVMVCGELADGRKLDRLWMPYKVATAKRPPYGIYVVCPEGEKGLLAFVRNGQI